ncbi:hypothetical protein GOODEAATRI_000553 [Goodea atripinnis]|uniref:Uncharacterized protein n=1 Tax=Goodea atripinnis TaxID=208336 RepID=A0ABV0NHG5_9TELE
MRAASPLTIIFLIIASGLRVPPAAQKWPSRGACLRSGRVCFLPVTKPRPSESVKELLGAECNSPNTSSSSQNQRDKLGKVRPAAKVTQHIQKCENNNLKKKLKQNIFPNQSTVTCSLSRKLSLISSPCEGVSSQNPGLFHCASAWTPVTDDSAFSLEEMRRPEASPG